MTEDEIPTLIMAARWSRMRFLMADGQLVDVVTPYGGDNADRELALDWAAPRTSGEARIAGISQVGPTDAPTGAPTVLVHRKRAAK
jgi:hypothetical protein